MGLRFMAQRPVCASISIHSIRKTYPIYGISRWSRVVFIEGARAFKHKRSILERNVFAAIATNGDQKESGSCPAVVVEVKVCGTVLVMGQ